MLPVRLRRNKGVVLFCGSVWVHVLPAAVQGHRKVAAVVVKVDLLNTGTGLLIGYGWHVRTDRYRPLRSEL